MKELAISQMVGVSIENLANIGVEVRACDTFDDVEKLFLSTGRERQTPMFDVYRNDFAKSDAFWLFLEIAGKTVGGAAAKYVDLAGETFDSYLRRTTKNQYGLSEDPIVKIAPPVTEELSGKLIYLGELEFQKDNRGALRALREFVVVLQGLAAMKWPDFDWMYAIVPDEHRNLARYYSFTWRCPNAITWSKEPPGRLDSHWLMAFRASHYEHLISSRVRGLAERKQG